MAGLGRRGEVFRVQHAVMGQVEAMKVLLADGSDEEQAQRFLREIDTFTASLEKPLTASGQVITSTGARVEGRIVEICSSSRPPL